MYIYLSIYPSIHPSIHPSIYLSIYLSHTSYINRKLKCNNISNIHAYYNKNAFIFFLNVSEGYVRMITFVSEY